jgi:hypothetical protein
MNNIRRIHFNKMKGYEYMKVREEVMIYVALVKFEEALRKEKIATSPVILKPAGVPRR